MRYFLLINNRKNENKIIDTLKDGFILKDVFSKDPNTAIIQFKSKEILDIVPYVDRVEYKENTGSSVATIEDYIVSDVVCKVNSQKPLIYLYTLTLANRKAELTTKRFIPSFCVTQPKNDTKKTIMDVYNRLRTNYPLETTDLWNKTRVLNVLPSFKLSSVDCKEILNGKTTIGEALEQLFSQIDNTYRVLPSVYMQESTHNIVLMPLNDTKKVMNDEDFINYEEIANGSDYAGTIESDINNGYDEEVIVYHPSIDSYVSMRGLSDDGAAITDENRGIRVKYPIYDVYRMSICIPVRVDIKYKSVNTSVANCPTLKSITTYVEYNITNYVFETNEGSILETPSKFREMLSLNFNEMDRSKALFYTYKGKTISGFQKTYGVFGTKTVLDNIIKLVSGGSHYDKIGNIEFSVLYQGIQHSGVAQSIPFESASMYSYFLDITELNYSMQDYLFNVIYRTILPKKRHKMERIDISKVNVDNSLSVNQECSIVDLKLAASNMYYNLNRLNDNKVTLCGKVKNELEVPKVGSKTNDNYVCIDIESTNYKDYVEFKATLVKNYAVINAYQQIDQEYRPFNISEQQVKSDLIYSEYILFSTSEVDDLKNNDSMFNDNQWLKILFNIEEAYVAQKAYMPSCAYFKSDAIDYQVSVPLIVSTFGNSIEFHFEFENQLSAGNSTASVSSSLSRNTAVKYTDDFGEFQTFEFRLLNRDYLGALSPDTYPKITTDYDEWKLEEEEYMLEFSDAEGLYALWNNDKIKSKTFKYIKDASEIFSFTYQLNFLPLKKDIDNIIVGNQISKNTLVSAATRFKKIYVSSAEKYNYLNNTQPLGSVSVDITATVFVDEKTNDRIIQIEGDTSGLTSIGLCDADGNLLLGINAIDGEIPKNIYIYYKNQRA